MGSDFRATARECLERANSLLASGSNDQLRYAALELRMALEALTYERALMYADDLPPSEYATWQPRRLLQTLLSLDPHADQGAALAVGLEELYGQPPKEMQSMGKEHVLSLATIKRNYDALGSVLHLPSLDQQSKLTGNALPVSLRDRCKALAEEVSKVLASPICNLRIKLPLKFDCRRCGGPVSKGMPPGAKDIELRCPGCKALYKLTHDVERNATTVRAMTTPVPCSDRACKETKELWEDEFGAGASWECAACKRRSILVLRVAPLKE